MSVFDAVVLAGSGKETELTKSEGVANKALIDIHGRPMLAWVIDALKKTNLISRIAVVGPANELKWIDGPEIIVPEKESLTDNLSAGFRALCPDKHFLIVSADIPFLTAESVVDFLSLCKPLDADFYYPVVGNEENERRFPGVERTYVALRDGVFTGGNIFLVNPHSLEGALPKVKQFFALRKSPLKLAAVLGFVFIVKLLTKRLTIRELEERIYVLLGLRGKAVISRYPEIGTDVDKPGDLALARRHLSA